MKTSFAALAVLLSALSVAAAIPARAQAVDAETLRKAGDATVDALRRNDLGSIESRFDGRMRDLFPHDRFESTWVNLRRGAGAMGACKPPTSSTRDAYTLLEYRCEFDLSPMAVGVALRSNGQVAGLFFRPIDDAGPAPAATPPGPVAAAEPKATAALAAADAKAPAAKGGAPTKAPAAAKGAPAPIAAPPAVLTPPPEPVAAPAPGRFPEEQVTTGAPGWPLPGTLVRPASGGRVPAVLLVHGSGPQDRDESLGPNKPLRDLAEGLAAKGIASLRYEKRTKALPAQFKQKLPNWTMDDEVVDDAVAAVLLLASRSDVASVVIVGHSQGAWLAPRIAAAASRKGVQVAGIVMLAAPLTPIADLIVYQYEFLNELPKPAVTGKQVDDIRTRRDNVAKLIADTAAGTPATPQAKPAPLLLDMPASAWLDMGRYDPAATLLDQPQLPALLIFGGRDFQVPIREKRMWQQAVGARSNIRIVEFPSVGHLMIEGQGAMTPAEYSKPGRVSQDVIDRIASWVNDRARGVPP